jgi:DNA (cytosine-5)-methyltransferase 1
MSIKLGSLFDGSGGFPLAGAISGIEPVWAAEVEPYPIAVTRSRFPRMEHLGSVTEVHGDKVRPVDVITFGSPCQDLSLAGKRAGIHDGQRSNLFFEAIRIIKEMRQATNGRYPTFVVWENVPGAFSSNKGEDFRCVLEEFVKVCGGHTVPRPDKSKWKSSGEIVGDGYSVAWRQLDAQYWGVPQRRKRIYLVADFAGGRAGEILFERESLRGHPAPGRAPGQGTSADTAGSAGGSSDVERLNPIYALQGNGIDRAETARCNGRDWREGVCYDARGNGDGTHCPTLTGNHENRVTDYTALCIGHGEPNSITMANQANTLTCMHDQQAVLTSGKLPRKYIIRRLTPLECCRLQGFPDGWGIPDHKDRLSNEELEFWQGVRDTCASIAGKPPKKYSTKSLTRWYNALHTDSAEYKMWGNGIALPCAAFVLGNVVNVIRENME